MKKKIVILFYLIIAFCFLHAGTYSGGSGTDIDPYQIADLDDLQELNNTTSDWTAGTHFIQTADIDASDTSTWDGGAGFDPIGRSSNLFYGHYDGDGHEIDGIYINRPTRDYAGFFGYTLNAEINNLGLTNVDITTDDFVGAFGGLVSGLTINDCYSTGNITGASRVGGLLGRVHGSSTIENCYSHCNVNNPDGWYNGGFIGLTQDCTISNCYANGSVYNPIGKYAGGFTGYSTSDILNCYSTCSVSGDDVVGGFMGSFYSGSIYSSYSNGSVNGNLDFGGFTGSGGTGIAKYCFWDIDTSNQSTSPDGTGKTTAEMKTQSTFTDAGWNFTTLWGISNSINSGYPYFQNLIPTDFPAGFEADIGGGTTIKPSVGLNFAGDQSIPPIPNGHFSPEHEFVLAGTGIVDLTITTTSLYGAYHQGGTWNTHENSEGSIIFPGVDFDARGDIPIIIGDEDPLPVSLSSFTAIQTQSNFAQINWTTQTESNISGYNILRNTINLNETTVKINSELILGTNTSNEQNYNFADNSVEESEYFYWLESVELSGNTELFGPISITIKIQPDNPTPPTTVIIGLHQNYPNPFNPETEILFALDEPGQAELVVYNIKGQKVITLFNNLANANEYIKVKWNGKDHSGNDVASGVYMYKLKASDEEHMRKMNLIK